MTATGENFRNIPFYTDHEARSFHYSSSPGNFKLPSEFPAFLLVRNNEWNDYSHVTSFWVYYFISDKEYNLFGETKIGQKGTDRYSTILPDDGYKSLGEDYCSLSENKNFYLNVRNQFPDDYSQFLLCLRDVALFPPIQEDFEDESVYRNSLLRSESSNYNLRAIKALLANEEYDSNYFKFTYKFKPKYADEYVPIDFNFTNEENGKGRIIGIIGENGCGKTQLISQLPFDLASENKNEFEGHKPKFDKVITVSYSAFDKFRLPMKTPAFNYAFCGLRKADGEDYTPSGLVKRFHYSWKEIRDTRKYFTWLKTIEDFLGEGITDQFIVEDEEFDIKIDLDLFKKFRETMSSGQQVLLFLITEVIHKIRTDSIILYDEPETHLHPNAITKIVQVIYRLTKSYDSYCIITTHSPLVIRELFSNNVYVLERSENLPLVRPISIESFGQSIDVINDEVFGNKAIEKHYIKVIDKLIEEKNDYHEVVQELSFSNHPLSLEILIYIKNKLKSPDA